MMILSREAAEHRAMELTGERRPEHAHGPWRWRPVSIRCYPLLLSVPQPFNPEDTYLNVGGVVRQKRGPLPPAWYVELRAGKCGQWSYEVLIAIANGRLLASLPGAYYGGEDCEEADSLSATRPPG